MRVADPKSRQIVPMRYFNLTLSPAEIEAFTADYLEQASPQADAARMMLRVVATTARMTTEIEELKRSQHSSSMWKLHVDSLAVLLDLARRLNLQSQSLEERESNMALNDSLSKLRARTGEAEKVLAA